MYPTKEVGELKETRKAWGIVSCRATSMEVRPGPTQPNPKPNNNLHIMWDNEQGELWAMSISILLLNHQSVIH